MDATANRINSSELIKKEFYVSPVTETERIENRRNMVQLLFTVTGSKIANRINLVGTGRKIRGVQPCV